MRVNFTVVFTNTPNESWWPLPPFSRHLIVWWMLCFSVVRPKSVLLRFHIRFGGLTQQSSTDNLRHSDNGDGDFEEEPRADMHTWKEEKNLQGRFEFHPQWRKTIDGKNRSAAAPAGTQKMNRKVFNRSYGADVFSLNLADKYWMNSKNKNIRKKKEPYINVYVIQRIQYISMISAHHTVLHSNIHGTDRKSVV